MKKSVVLKDAAIGTRVRVTRDAGGPAGAGIEHPPAGTEGVVVGFEFHEPTVFLKVLFAEWFDLVDPNRHIGKEEWLLFEDSELEVIGTIKIVTNGKACLMSDLSYSEMLKARVTVRKIPCYVRGTHDWTYAVGSLDHPRYTVTALFSSARRAQAAAAYMTAWVEGFNVSRRDHG